MLTFRVWKLLRSAMDEFAAEEDRRTGPHIPDGTRARVLLVTSTHTADLRTLQVPLL